MYLATGNQGTSRTYQIRQSFLDPYTDIYRHRLIFDLGHQPADHIELLNHEFPYFSTALQKAITSHTDEDCDSLLEKLLWDFLPWDTRQLLSRFRREHHDIPKPLSDQDRADIARQIHLFDRKRLYFLRYGAIDQSRLYRMHEKLCRPLLGQSRDEREYAFAAMEKVLEPGEYHSYIYAILDLQKHFTASFAPFLPEALAHDEIADYCIEELCRLNIDENFRRGMPPSDSLHPHLRRYLIMFFDFMPRNRSFNHEYAREFMDARRSFRWPAGKPAVSAEQMSELFGDSYGNLKKLNRRELSRLYRKKAMDLHPDQGGDHDRFVQLTEVYHDLRRGKK